MGNDQAADVRLVDTDDADPAAGEIIQKPSGDIVIGVPVAPCAAEAPMPSGESA